LSVAPPREPPIGETINRWVSVNHFVVRHLLVGVLCLIAEPVLGCATNRIDAEAKVIWIYDGDTIELEGGEKLRLIGINTPERGRHGKAAQAYALAAWHALQQILARHNYHVLLRYGEERRDPYGRLLAHLYLSNQSNVNADLLRRGLAIAITIPPNDWNVDCYRSAEAQARRAKIGIWSLPQYRTLESSRLKGSEHGFHIIAGTVTRIGQSSRALWLDLKNKLGVRIDHTDEHNFDSADLAKLKGKRIEVRGWLYQTKSALRMRLRHPADLKILP
jgi:endonuclease YncB( thermonuclease family)